MIAHDPMTNAEKVRAFPAGATVLEAGATPTCMYVVRRGQLAVRLGDATIDTVGEGVLLGELSLIDEGERSAIAEALTDRELVPIDQREFAFLVQQMPHVRR